MEGCESGESSPAPSALVADGLLSTGHPPLPKRQHLLHRRRRRLPRGGCCASKLAAFSAAAVTALTIINATKTTLPLAVSDSILRHGAFFFFWAAAAPTNGGGGREDGDEDSYAWASFDLYQILGLSDPPPPPRRLAVTARHGSSFVGRGGGGGGVGGNGRVFVRSGGSGSDSGSGKNDRRPLEGGSGKKIKSHEGKLKSRRRRIAERAAVKGDHVRRAYLRQSLLHHPDKVRSRRSRKFDAGGGGSSSGGLGESDEATSTHASEDESAARFARISEAYSVLSDPIRRAEYDAFLLDAEDEASGVAPKVPNFLQNFTKDARCVFEEFFAPRDNWANEFGFAGGSSSGGGGGGEDGEGYDPPIELISFLRDDGDVGGGGRGGGGTAANDAGGGRGYWRGTFQRSPPKGAKKVRRLAPLPPPDSVLLRTSERVITSYDARFDADVVTVLRRETFAVRKPDGQLGGVAEGMGDGGEVYHRTVRQDFIEVESRCSGRTLGHIAVSRPYLTEGGMVASSSSVGGGGGGGTSPAAAGDHSRREPTSPGRGGGSWRTLPKSWRQQSPRRRRRRFDSALLPHESLTPGDRPLVSPDGRYRAGLTRECRIEIVELTVVGGEANDRLPTSAVIWSSKNGPPSRPDRCRMAMYGPQLILGDAEFEDDVLWFTPPLIPDSASASSSLDVNWGEEEEDGGGDEFYYYYASLDNDGRMGVYKRWRRRGSRDASTTAAADGADDLHNDYDDGFYGDDPAMGNAANSAADGSDIIRLFWSSVRRLVSDTLIRSKDSSSGGPDACIYVTGRGRNGCQISGRQPIRVEEDGVGSGGVGVVWSWALVGFSARLVRPVMGAVRRLVMVFF